jgi:YidC/Oxa1 family membrane protein insertase
MYPGLWAWLAWFSHLLFKMLAVIQSMVPVWGFAIIVLSLSVQILTLPLSRFAERLQGQVRDIEARLQPEISSIKASFKGALQAEKILSLYKREQVHPLYSLKSLAGLVVVVPVFIGAFNMLAENVWLSGQSFLWIADLSRPDAAMELPFSMPFLGGSLNLLPFIMTALNVAAALLLGANMDSAELRKRHYRRSWAMAIIFLLLFYTFPAAMVLYWAVINLFSLVIAGRHFMSRR